LLFKTGLLRDLLNLIPDDQPLVKIIAALVLAFVGAGLGGAVNRAFRGYSLALIDPSGRRRRYVLGGSFAQGISQGLLLIPVLLLIALVGKYNPGST
jgi:hypothetical protein